MNLECNKIIVSNNLQTYLLKLINVQFCCDSSLISVLQDSTNNLGRLKGIWFGGKFFFFFFSYLNLWQ